MYENAIKIDGKIAIRYYMPIPKYIQIGKKDYVCDVRHGVSMLLVEENEVAPLLSYKGGCCGGERLVFSLPNQEAVNVFLTGDR